MAVDGRRLLQGFQTLPGQKGPAPGIPGAGGAQDLQAPLLAEGLRIPGVHREGPLGEGEARLDRILPFLAGGLSALGPRRA
jgi:hypothetical protein